MFSFFTNRLVWKSKGPISKKGIFKRLELLGLEERITPADFVVANLNDAGDGSLRQAITAANGTLTENDTITFQSGLTGIITLQSSLPTIDNAATSGTLTITGPGATALTISGNNQDFRIFEIATGGNLTISGVTVSGAETTINGAGFFNQGTLAISASILSGNKATSFQGYGGGIYNTGTATISNSTLSGNSAKYGSGGGIFNAGTATLTISNSTLSGNSASYGGGLFNAATATLTISDSTLDGNSSPSRYGGGLFNAGTATISDSTLSGNTALNKGGGIFNAATATLTISDSTLDGNSSPSRYGGGIFNAGTAMLSNSTLSGNSAGYGGGGIYNSGTATISNSILSGNSASGGFGGGGIFNRGTATLTISGSTLSENKAKSSGFGGGIINDGTATLTISDSTLSRNSANRGGGIHNASSGTVTLSNSTLSENTATDDGGGIYKVTGTLSISNSTLSENTATVDGGGILNLTDTLSISDSTFSGNSAGSDGGGILNFTATLAISNSTLSGNSAGTRGGGIFNYSSATINNSTLSGNSATNGGGINNQLTATLTISSSTLSDNNATNNGGGILNFMATLAISNSTLSGNSATNNGGGILNSGRIADLTISNSTLSGNSATNGGGIYNNGDTFGDSDVTIHNSIIANSTGGDFVNGSFGTVTETSNNNLVTQEGLAWATTATPAQINLGPLQNNGGPTSTLALGAGSVAIGAGDPAISNASPINGLDQRGINRTTSDMGAYSFGIQVTTTLDTENSGDGVTSLREAINLANTTPGNDQISFAFATGAAPYTITLASSALPTILDASATVGAGTVGTLTITGPGASSLTISGNNGDVNRNFRIFDIASGGNLTISGVTVSGAKVSGSGGGFRNAGNLAISNSTISGNNATVNGGGIDNTGTATINNSTLSSNIAIASGGGISNAGTTTISNSTLSGNSARFGGGILNDGTVTISNSTLSGNTATDGGGIDNTGSATINNCTISGNTGDFGGGIANDGTANITNSTISGNSANLGGGIRNTFALNIANSIITNSTSGGDFAGAGTVTGSSNLVTQSGLDWATTATSAEINLGPLQNNGGPTFTHALLSPSAAISTTALVTPNLDQRGFTRSNNDIGSFAYQAPTGADNVFVAVNQSGQVGLFLSSAGAAITDFHTSFAGSTLTITAITAGNITGGGTGITIDNTAKTITVDLNMLTAFSGVVVEGNSGADTVTIGAGGVDLSLVTGGGADQSLIITTGTGSDGIAVGNAIKTKGAGQVSLTSRAIGITADITTAAGNIVIDADSGVQQAGSFSGVEILGAGVDITTSGGNITVEGRGGDSGLGFQLGVFLDGGARIQAGGTGTVVVTGTGGASSGPPNFGVFVVGPDAGNISTITSAGGAVSVTGTGGGSGASNFNYGVIISTAGIISAGGTGTVTVTGTGGLGSGGNNDGLYLSGFGVSKVTSAGGAVLITGAAGATSGRGLYLECEISAGAGAPITLNTDSIGINTTSGFVTSTGTVTLRNNTSGTAINLGTTTAGQLSLTDEELDRITAGTLVIGRNDGPNSGVITVSSALSLTPNLQLVGPAGITLGADITTTGSQTFTGAVTLGDNATLATTDSNILFSSTVNGAKNLFMTTGKGDVTFTGAIGISAPLTGLTVTAGTIAIDDVGGIGVGVNGSGSLTASTGGITFTGTVYAAQNHWTFETLSTQNFQMNNGGSTINFDTINGNMKFLNGNIILADGVNFSADVNTSGNLQIDGEVDGTSSEDVSLFVVGGGSASVGAIGTQVANGINRVVVFGTSSNLPIILNGNITTDNTAQNEIILSGAVTLNTDVQLSTGAATADPGNNNISINGTVNSAASTNKNLTLNALGDVAITGTIGANQALGGLSLTGNDISLGNIGAGSAGVIGVVSVQANDAGEDTGSIALTGVTYATTGNQFYSSGTGTSGTGLITLTGGSSGNSVSMSTGGNQFEVRGVVQINGRFLIIQTTGAGDTGGNITFNDSGLSTEARVEGPGSLILFAGTTGAISMNGPIGEGVGKALSSLVISNAGSASFNGAITAGTVTLTDTTDAGTVAFQGNLTITAGMSIAASGAYNVQILGGSNSIAGATTFLNTGTVTLGNGFSDSTTFTGGLTGTAPSSLALQGTVATTNTDMNLGDADTGVTINGIFSFPANLDAGTGSINLAGNVFGSGSNNPLKVITSAPGVTTLTGVNTAEIQMSSGVVTMANPSVQAGGYRVSGGTLQGGSMAGQVGYIFAQTGTSILAPGINGPGEMHTKALLLSSGNTVQIDLQGTTQETGYDQFFICGGGSVDLDNATLSLASTITPVNDTVFTIIDNNSGTAVVGTFNGLAEGSLITSNNKTFRISYKGGTGDDVTLTVVEAPAITSANNATFIQGLASNSFQVTATGFPTTFTYTVSAGALPTGVTLNPGTGVLSGAPAPGSIGTYNLAITTSNGVSPDATQPFTLKVNPTPSPLITGTSYSQPGQVSTVTLFNSATGEPIGIATPFPGFTGEIHIAAGDVNGDGIAEIIAAAGPGGGPAIAILDSQTGVVLSAFFAYDPAFRGGSFVADADVNGDGFTDILTGAGPGGGPHVKVFDGANQQELASFFAYAQEFKGGVTVGATVSDGSLYIVTGAGPGGGPHVKVFQGNQQSFSIISQWYAYPVDFSGGVFVATGDISNDGQVEVVTGAGTGGGPVVAVWNPQNASLLAQFFAYETSFTGGVRVGVSDGNGDGILDLVTGAGPGGGPLVKGFSFPELDLLFQFFDGPEFNTAGVFVS